MQLIFYCHIILICNFSFCSCIEQSFLLSLMSELYYHSDVLKEGEEEEQGKEKQEYYNIIKKYFKNIYISSSNREGGEHCSLYDTRRESPSIVLASCEHIINCVCSGSTWPDKVCEINSLECWLPRWLSLHVSVSFISGVLSHNSNCRQ